MELLPVEALISLCLENPPHNPMMKKEQVSSSTLHCPALLRRQETHPSPSGAHEAHPSRLLLPGSSSSEGMLQPHWDGHSQNHRIVKVQKELSDHQMQPSTQHQHHVHLQTMSSCATSARCLNTGRDVDSAWRTCFSAWQPLG